MTSPSNPPCGCGANERPCAYCEPVTLPTILEREAERRRELENMDAETEWLEGQRQGVAW